MYKHAQEGQGPQAGPQAGPADGGDGGQAGNGKGDDEQVTDVDFEEVK